MRADHYRLSRANPKAPMKRSDTALAFAVVEPSVADPKGTAAVANRINGQASHRRACQRIQGRAWDPQREL